MFSNNLLVAGIIKTVKIIKINILILFQIIRNKKMV